MTTIWPSLPSSFTRVQHADDRAFIRAEEALQVRVGLDDGLGQVGRFELVARAVLHVNDVDVRVACLPSGSRNHRARSMPVRLVWSCTMTATSPSPPISSAILSAARAAAATLSVAAVVTGMSLSTPESKPTTGIPSALACSSSGVSGLGVQRRQAQWRRVSCRARSGAFRSACRPSLRFPGLQT